MSGMMRANITENFTLQKAFLSHQGTFKATSKGNEGWAASLCRYQYNTKQRQACTTKWKHYEYVNMNNSLTLQVPP